MRPIGPVLSACLVLALPATLGAAPGDEMYARPGQIVAAHGARLNLYCTGSGQPTVVFDAGHQDWAAAWAVVQPQVAKWTRTCSYDRPGSGFSDPGPMPRTSERIADELHAALHAAGVPGPYLVVGHAFGGFNVRAFAYRYMLEVAGMVLIDTDVGDVVSPEMREATHKVFDAQAAELRACRDALAAGKPLSSVPPPADDPKLTCEQRFFRGFPEKAWSPQLNAALLHDAQTQVALFDEVIAELEAMPGDEVDLQTHRLSFGSRPIRVITAARPTVDSEATPTDVHVGHLKREYERALAQARLLELSTNAKQIFAYRSRAAYVQFDQPDLVVDAIRDAVEQARSPAAGRTDGGAAADTLYAGPGQLVPADDGARLSFYCLGSGSPTVVFDSGWEDWAPAWKIVHPEVAKWTRACAYDRAGAGFSEPGPMPRTSVRIADELRSALHHAGIDGPYVLVGHAFGGDNVRTFADRYPSDVAGLVLVECDADELEPADLQAEAHRGHAELVARLRECRDAVAGGKPLPLLPARPGSPPRTCAQQFFRGIPERAFSAELNAKLLELAQTKVAMYDAYISEMEETARDEAYLKQHRRSLGSRPIRVLSTGNHGVGSIVTPPAPSLKHLRYEYEATLGQSRWLGLSTNAVQVFVAQSSEYIPLDQPQAVIQAIREVVEASRGANGPPR